MKKFAYTIGPALALVLSFSIAQAHVIVSPNTAVGGSYQTFSVSVPSERAFATTRVRLLVPDGITSVRPTVKPGWTVSMKTEQQGTSTPIVQEIDWTGGTIPVNFRDDFSFSVKLPATGPLIWKVYQLYSDGTEVGWDQAPIVEPGGHNHESPIGPYSQTILSAPVDPHADHAGHDHGIVTPELFLIFISLGLSIISVIELIKLERKGKL